jgi:hypothetical protein
MTNHVLSASELRQHAHAVLGREVGELSTDEIEIVLTFSTYVTDLCAAELARRGVISLENGVSQLPYRSHHTAGHMIAQLSAGEGG